MAELDSAQAGALFGAIRDILGRGLQQSEVDKINRALMGSIAIATTSGMKCGPDGINLIHSFESCKLSTYKDPGSANGLPITGGWGSTRDHNGQPFKLGFSADQAYWDALFTRDIASFETGVNLLIGDKPTTQHQFDALVSFAYNVGLDIDDDTKAEGLGDSTLLKRHLAKDYSGAFSQFALWNKNDGAVMKGLTRRRAAEAALYSSS